MGQKGFKTVKEQITTLEQRGVSFSDREAAGRFLLKESYYVVVNGYKEAFIDKQASNLAGEDRYREGTSFDQFVALYRFDSALRRETMDIILKAESAMKTATVHAFCDVHRDADAYLDPMCYCRKDDYKPSEKYTSSLIRLLSTLQGVHDNKLRKRYIKHYLDKHRCVPLWVAAKCLTFGNMSAFFDLQTQAVKTKSCANLARALGKKSVKQRQLAYAYHTLPEFRNICAHDERLYCTKVGKNEDKGFAELLRSLSTVTEEGELAAFASKVAVLVEHAEEEGEEFKKMVCSGLGVDVAKLREIADAMQ